MEASMPGSVIGFLIVVVAVLPGAAYTWAFERQAGSFGVSFADRTLRFIGSSVAFHLVLAPLDWWLYRTVVPLGKTVDGGEFLAVWAAVAVLSLLPYTLGAILGGLYRTRENRDAGWTWVRRWLSEAAEKRLLRVVLGHDPAPRAWDHLFAPRPNTFVRAKLTDGTWVAGKFFAQSYAGGYPNPTDLLLEEAWSIDPVDATLGEHGLGYALYISADQIAWLEILGTERGTTDRTDRAEEQG
jgi:hypothetical protein